LTISPTSGILPAMIVPRTLHEKLVALSRRFPVVTVTGPRQSGKSTLCRMTFPDRPYVSFEAPDVRSYALTDPRGFLAEHSGGAILDEIQRVPDLLSYLQTEVDERPRRGRFILTGSANLQLMASLSQSLAGRTAVIHLLPMGYEEVLRFRRPPRDPYEAVFRGGYPALHERKLDPLDWFNGYVATYVERDVRQLLRVGDLVAFQTFLRMCATRSAQLLNLAGLGADCGVTHATARAWISVLETSYLVLRLPAWAASAGKRLVKTPKLHFLDTGLLCYLLGIRSAEQLRHHPLRGAVFETWTTTEVLKSRFHRGLPAQLSYFRDRKGLEVDLLVERGDALIAVETKSGATVASDAFGSMRRLSEMLGAGSARPRLRQVLVYSGRTRQDRSDVTVLPWSEVPAFDWAGK
jgi:predicted AAA+ superfamily ATPase